MRESEDTAETTHGHAEDCHGWSRAHDLRDGVVRGSFARSGSEVGVSGDPPIRVLIVDDSLTARVALRAALNSDGSIHVVGDAEDGVAALAQVRRLRPDLVTMDVYMAGKGGIEVTEEIMQTQPTPILVVTADNPKSPSLLYKAIQAGALDVCAKLPAPISAEYEARRRELTRLVKALAKVPVVRRRRSTPALPTRESRGDARRSVPPAGPPKLLLLGASTGGPPLVCDLLKRLPAEFALPIAVVQHLSPGFAVGFAEWLTSETRRKVVVVDRPMTCEARTVYLAADDCHLEVVGPDRLVAGRGLAVHYQRPSVDVLFASAAKYLGARVLAVLMTGMGTDGAEGMELLFRAGARTFAQKPSTCAVDSMPKAAISRGAARYVVEPAEMAGAVALAMGGGEAGAGA